ncbi:MAG: hypothetical protein CXT78_01125 [Thaumarchaeota archaeon]|nr:MAG: hypothetical protein CXT78_01125 [Nitrososphaerota archaeon]
MLDVKKIMIVGCGGIGSRHLEALCKIMIPIKLFAVDPNEKSLQNAKKLASKVIPNNNIKSINFLKELPENIDKIDLCILATSSDVRLKVLKQIISIYPVKNMILEKVLFQSIHELDEAKNIIAAKKINCWVNCFRREEKCWKKIKDYFLGNSNMKLYYGKSDWSMCCNSIHIVDLAVWLFNSKIKHIDISNLNNTIYQSKRQGFIELTGILSGKLENGGTFVLESIHEIPEEKVEFEISSDTRKIKINEYEGKAILYKKENNWVAEEYEFHIPFQSEKTQKIVEKILEYGECDLTTLNESIEIHKPLLDNFITHLNKISDSKYTYCPIT